MAANTFSYKLLVSFSEFTHTAIWKQIFEVWKFNNLWKFVRFESSPSKRRDRRTGVSGDSPNEANSHFRYLANVSKNR